MAEDIEEFWDGIRPPREPPVIGDRQRLLLRTWNVMSEEERATALSPSRDYSSLSPELATFLQEQRALALGPIDEGANSRSSVSGDGRVHPPLLDQLLTGEVDHLLGTNFLRDLQPSQRELDEIATYEAQRQFPQVVPENISQRLENLVVALTDLGFPPIVTLEANGQNEGHTLNIDLDPTFRVLVITTPEGVYIRIRSLS